MNKIEKILGGVVLSAVLVAAPISSVTINAAENENEVDYQTYFDVDSVTFEEFNVKINDDQESVTRIVVTDQDGKKLFSVKKEEETVYTSVGLNLREVPTIESTPVAAYVRGTEIKRVGNTDFGWDIVEIDGKNYFMWDEYLTTEKPVVEEYTYNETEEVDTSTTETETSYDYETSYSTGTYSASDLRSMGVINWGGWRWTWYSQNVLPGGGLDIPGRHVDENGYVCDGDGYICLASGSLAKGTVVDTPFGKAGKVYDSGCAADTLDVYTNF